MAKAIDGDKLIGLLGYLIEATDSKLEKNLLWSILEDIESGKCDPTPPVQPTLQRGDKVRHKDFKNRGPGVVMLAMGQKAQVYFEKTEIGQPVKAYYRLDKLEVIPDDPST
ncbi:hypothetical protein [Paenibacillus sp. FSL M7-0896]|uniref:hypothetical protein n=1 Tax=Paenibacillus sp. FSL M7-0896 TaxID=2921610 RepID=UPI0030DDBCC8